MYYTTQRVTYFMHFFRHSFFLLALGISTPGFAGIHFSLSGSHSESNTGYQTVEAGALSAGVAFDVGQFIRLGYTHLQQLQASKGFTCEENSPTTSVPDGNGGYLTCPTFVSRAHIVGHSIDLTLILYAGQIMTPYITLGAGPRTYKITSKKADQPEETDTGGGASMNGTVGVTFKLSHKFSLKLSYSMTGGQKKTPGTAKPEQTVDGAAQVGLQFSI